MASPRISDPQSLNRYVYALNNPERYVDLDGLIYYEIIDNGDIVAGGIKAVLKSSSSPDKSAGPHKDGIEKTSMPKVRATSTPNVRTWIGNPSRFEIYYVYAFLLSIVLGIVYGFADKTFYYATIPYLPRSESAFAIFLHNFSLDLVSIVTGGIFGLLSNFVTFSVLSAGLEVRHVGLLKTILIVGLALCAYGILEITGRLCLSLTGFTYLERIVWKKTTRLRRDRIFVLGTALVFVAALTEWLLEIYFPRPSG